MLSCSHLRGQGVHGLDLRGVRVAVQASTWVANPAWSRPMSPGSMATFSATMVSRMVFMLTGGHSGVLRGGGR